MPGLKAQEEKIIWFCIKGEERRDVEDGKEVIKVLVDRIVARKPSNIVYLLHLNTRKKAWVSNKDNAIKAMKYPYLIKGTDYRFETNMSTARIKSTARQLMTCLGYKQDDIHLETRTYQK